MDRSIQGGAVPRLLAKAQRGKIFGEKGVCLEKKNSRRRKIVVLFSPPFFVACLVLDRNLWKELSNGKTQDTSSCKCFVYFTIFFCVSPPSLSKLLKEYCSDAQASCGLDPSLHCLPTAVGTVRVWQSSYLKRDWNHPVRYPQCRGPTEQSSARVLQHMDGHTTRSGHGVA